MRGWSGKSVPAASPAALEARTHACENSAVLLIGLGCVIPAEGKRRFVCRIVAQYEKFIEERTRETPHAAFGLVSLLERMHIPALACRLIASPRAFVRRSRSRTIDADNPDRDRLAVVRFELRYLILHVRDNAVDLLNHRLVYDFHLDAYFDRRDWAAFDGIPGVGDCRRVGDNLAKASIAPAGFYPDALVLHIQD